MRCPGTRQAVEHSGTTRSHHPRCSRRSRMHWCPGLDRAVPPALNGGIPDRAVLWTTAVFLSTKQGTASPAGPVHDCLQSPTPAVSLGANGQCCQGLCRETAFPVRRDSGPISAGYSVQWDPLQGFFFVSTWATADVLNKNTAPTFCTTGKLHMASRHCI